MAESPRKAEINTLEIKVLADGKEVYSSEVISIYVDKQINKMPKAKVAIMDGDGAIQKFEHSTEANFEPGKTLEIQAGYEDKMEVLFKGIIIKHRVKLQRSGRSYLIIHGGDKALKQTLGRKNKYYEEKKDSDIIKEALEDVAGEIDTTEETHNLIIQNNATNWDFAMSRAEVNGLVAIVDDGKVDIVKPKVSEAPALEVAFGDSLIDFDIEVDAQNQLKEVKSKAWDYKALEIIESSSSEPETYAQGNLDGSKLAKVLGVSEYTLNTTAAVTTDTLKSWADAQLIKSRLARIQGTLTFTGNAKAVPNSTIEVKGISPRLNGNGFISGVEHTIEEGLWRTKVTLGLPSSWFTEEYSNVTQSPAAGLLPGIRGLQNGKVKALDKDPEGQLRIFVDIPMIDPTGVGVWARLASFYASSGFGAYFIPEVGDEVILGFVNDDPNFPIILGSLYNGDSHTAPYDFEEENNEKGILTREKLKVTFNEEKKSIVIETPAKNMITLDDDGELIELKDQHGSTITMDTAGITLDSSKDIKLTANSGKVEIVGSQGISLSSDQDIKLDAGMNIKNSASMNFEAEGTAGSKLTSSAKVDVNGSAMVVIKGGLVKIN